MTIRDCNGVFLAPVIKGVMQEAVILVALFDKLFTCTLEQKHLTIKKVAALLENIDGVGIAGCNLLNDLTSSGFVLHQLSVVGSGDKLGGLGGFYQIVSLWSPIIS